MLTTEKASHVGLLTRQVVLSDVTLSAGDQDAVPYSGSQGPRNPQGQQNDGHLQWGQR